MSIILSPDTEELLRPQIENQKVFDSQVGFVLLKGTSLAPDDKALTATAHIPSVRASSGIATTSVMAIGILTYDLHIPNAETARAVREARAGIDLVRTSDREDLFRKLNE